MVLHGLNRVPELESVLFPLGTGCVHYSLINCDGLSQDHAAHDSSQYLLHGGHEVKNLGYKQV